MSQIRERNDVVIANMQRILSTGVGSLPDAVLDERDCKRFSIVGEYTVVNLPFLCVPSEGRIFNFRPHEKAFPGLAVATYCVYTKQVGNSIRYGIMQFNYEKDTLSETAARNLMDTGEENNMQFDFPVSPGNFMPLVANYEFFDISSQRQSSGFVPLEKSKTPRKDNFYNRPSEDGSLRNPEFKVY